MATRNPLNVNFLSGDCTDFVLHSSQRSSIDKSSGCRIYDYTEYRLIRYAQNTEDAQQKLVLMALITDYRVGLVAVAWKRGQPVPLRVTKE